MSAIAPLSTATIDAIVALALAEDVGRGDVTTGATVDRQARSSARIVFRVPGVVCGLPLAAAVFQRLDPKAVTVELAAEGTLLRSPGAVARIECSAAALLTGERVALNLVAHLAAVATLARRYVDAVAGTAAVILDTRKTTPGLRALEKYAVRVGGARNHRVGLDDGIIIKDNHLQLAGGVSEAVRRARRAVAPGLRVEIEVDTLDQLREALAVGADIVLLDNMPLEMLREAVAIVGGRVPLEASGGVNLQTVRTIAETGVDFISVGALTHSAPAIDVSLEIP